MKSRSGSMSLQRSITQIQVNLNLTMKSTSNRSQQPTPSFKIWLSEDSTTLLEPPETQTVRTILIMNTKRRRKKHTLTILAPVVSVIEVKVSKLLTIGNVPRKMTIITTSSTKTQDKSGIRTRVTIGEGISTRLAQTAIDKITCRTQNKRTKAGSSSYLPTLW